MVNPMTTTREEQRDAFATLNYRSVAKWERKQGREELARVIESAADEIDHLRSASQAGGVPADVIVAAYKRGWHWNNENEGDDTFLNKAANDYADKVLSAAAPPAIGAGGVPAGWRDINTAPKDGTWVLCLAKRATVPVIASHQFSTGGIGRWIDKDASDFSGHDDPSEAWIEYWNSNSYTPTHWMPLPPRPDDRTNASEAQSGSLNQALPASSVSATDAVEAERTKWAAEVAEISGRLRVVEKIQGIVRADERKACEAAIRAVIAPVFDDVDSGFRAGAIAALSAILARGTENGEQS